MGHIRPIPAKAADASLLSLFAIPNFLGSAPAGAAILPPMPRPLLVALAILGVSRAAIAVGAEAGDFATVVQPFFKEHCNRCHGEESRRAICAWTRSRSI